MEQTLNLLNKKIVLAILSATLLLIVGAIFFVCTHAVSAASAVQGPKMSLTIDGIKGTFDVKSFDLQVVNKSNLNTSSNPNNAIVSGLKVTMPTTSNSVELFSDAEKGSTIKTGTLTIHQGSGAIVKLTLKNLMVASYGTSGSDQDLSLLDNVSFSFAQIQMVYVDAGGNSSTTDTWNLTTNVSV